MFPDCHSLNFVNDCKTDKTLNAHLHNRAFRTAIVKAAVLNLFTQPIYKKIGAIATKTMVLELDNIKPKCEKQIDSILWECGIFKDKAYGQMPYI